MIETATAVRFSASSSAHYHHRRSSEEVNAVHVTSRPRIRSPSLSLPWLYRSSKCGRLYGGCCYIRRNRIRALASDSWKKYHPYEEISETRKDAVLTPQETARTIVEVNSKATLMLTGLISEDIHENLILPDLPYVTDDQGDIYFQVKNEADILQTLTSENDFVQAVIGFDTVEMMSEIEFLGSSEIDFGFETIDDEDSDIEEDEDEEDEDYDEDMVEILEDVDEEDDSDEILGDWAKLETMQSCHPMYFAKRVAQVASDAPIDWMEQPPAGLVIQGLIRPTLTEEHSYIQSHMSGKSSHHAEINQTEKTNHGKMEKDDGIDGQDEPGISEDISIQAEESGKDQAPISGTSFYKLEIFKIQLISSHGHKAAVEVEDFRKAQPDAIAHSAGKILSRLKSGGDKITQALKSLCWRCKGLQVEEAAVIGIDSLGFDLRVCSGTQIQTFRFSFNSRATAGYIAENQLNDILFPRIPPKAPKKKHSHQNEH